MNNWWTTDERLMNNWWMTDEWLMNNWWTTDEQLINNWLMTIYWWLGGFDDIHTHSWTDNGSCWFAIATEKLSILWSWMCWEYLKNCPNLLTIFFRSKSYLSLLLQQRQTLGLFITITEPEKECVSLFPAKKCSLIFISLGRARGDRRQRNRGAPCPGQRDR